MTNDRARISRRRLLTLGAGAVTAGLAGCLSGVGSEAASPTPTAESGSDDATANTLTPTATAGGTDWRAVELTDVRSGDAFTVEQFEGRPVLLEFFAVWCPVCTKQQKVLGDVIGRLDDLVVISLNTDPNEDADRVRSHLNQHQEFDWRYAIAPSAMTQSLIDQFGSVIATPPAAPVVRVCPDGVATLVDGRGVKSAGTLVDAVERC